MEYEGACYHVINRGNYRRWVFETEGAKEAFEQCVAECATKAGWMVHAWVVMGNHFHLAVETPQGNLGAGMQWLQTTYAARFNRYRSEQGHLFGGRYKAIVVERGEALGRVCHYIDLNPGSDQEGQSLLLDLARRGDGVRGWPTETQHSHHARRFERECI